MNCQRSGRFEKRVCYWFGDEAQVVNICADVSDENDAKYFERGDAPELTAEEVMTQIIVPMTARLQDRTALDVMNAVAPAVCVKSMGTEEMQKLITLESFSREYHVPPLGDTPLGEYPAKLIDIFCVIGNVREKFRIKEMEAYKQSAQQRDSHK